jgi:hypothetical protein
MPNSSKYVNGSCFPTQICDYDPDCQYTSRKASRMRDHVASIHTKEKVRNAGNGNDQFILSY